MFVGLRGSNSEYRQRGYSSSTVHHRGDFCEDENQATQIPTTSSEESVIHNSEIRANEGPYVTAIGVAEIADMAVGTFQKANEQLRRGIAGMSCNLFHHAGRLGFMRKFQSCAGKCDCAKERTMAHRMMVGNHAPLRFGEVIDMDAIWIQRLGRPSKLLAGQPPWAAVGIVYAAG